MFSFLVGDVVRRKRRVRGLRPRFFLLSSLCLRFVMSCRRGSAHAFASPQCRCRCFRYTRPRMNHSGVSSSGLLNGYNRRYHIPIEAHVEGLVVAATPPQNLEYSDVLTGYGLRPRAAKARNATSIPIVSMSLCCCSVACCSARRTPSHAATSVGNSSSPSLLPLCILPRHHHTPHGFLPCSPALPATVATAEHLRFPAVRVLDRADPAELPADHVLEVSAC